MIANLKTTAALALAATLPLAVPAHAGASHEDIVVSSNAAMEEWQQQATRSLNRSLERNPLERSAQPEPGIVQITFELGDNGRPANIELHSSSSNWAAVRSARFAVRRLGDISDVPVADADKARFIANIIFADNPQQHGELLALLEQSERERLASETGESELIALGG